MKVLTLPGTSLGEGNTACSSCVGAQILRDCGVQKMALMGQPRRMPSMAGYGLEITGFIPKE